MYRAVLRRIARQPGFLRREAHQRRQPRAGVAEDVLDRLQRRPALGAGIGLAVERILADVEIERRQIGVHELRQHCNHALVVVVGVGLAHDLVELDEAMQHDLLQLRHGLGGMPLLAVVVGQRAQHPAQRVPELAIGLGGALQHRRARNGCRRCSRRTPPTGAGCRRPRSSSGPAARACCPSTSTSSPRPSRRG